MTYDILDALDNIYIMPSQSNGYDIILKEETKYYIHTVYNKKRGDAYYFLKNNDMENYPAEMLVTDIILDYIFKGYFPKKTLPYCYYRDFDRAEFAFVYLKDSVRECILGKGELNLFDKSLMPFSADTLFDNLRHMYALSKILNLFKYRLRERLEEVYKNKEKGGIK